MPQPAAGSKPHRLALIDESARRARPTLPLPLPVLVFEPGAAAGGVQVAVEPDS